MPNDKNLIRRVIRAIEISSFRFTTRTNKGVQKPHEIIYVSENDVRVVGRYKSYERAQAIVKRKQKEYTARAAINAVRGTNAK